MFASQKRSKWSHLQILSSETRVNCVQWRRWRRADFLLGKTWPVVRVRETLGRKLFHSWKLFRILKTFPKCLKTSWSDIFPKLSKTFQKCSKTLRSDLFCTLGPSCLRFLPELRTWTSSARFCARRAWNIFLEYFWNIFVPVAPGILFVADKSSQYQDW